MQHLAVSLQAQAEPLFFATANNLHQPTRESAFFDQKQTINSRGLLMTRRAIGVSERPPLLQTIPLSLQHLFAMFGATVLVPILFHINPATVLLFNGVGTLLYLFICKGKIPAYLGSSFAFISPVLLLLPLGYEVALGDLFSAACCSVWSR